MITLFKSLKSNKKYFLGIVFLQITCILIYYTISLQTLKYYSNSLCKTLLKDEIINITKIYNQQENFVNYLCEAPSLNYDHILAYSQVENDHQYLKSIFDSCSADLKFEDFIKIIRPNRTSSNEIYTLKLKIDSIKKNFDQKSKNIRCFIQRFDKMMNMSEKKQILKYFDELYEFKSKTNYELKVNNFGFFYLNCINDSNRTIFDYVYNIMPSNMSKLFEQRNEHKILTKKRINQFKIDSKIKKMMYENDYQKNSCYSKNKSIHEKMNVLLIGIDSLSHDQFTRIFPLTYLYLRNHLKDTLFFKRFNSNGENTLPNMFALLSGIAHYNMSEYNVSSDLDFYMKNDETYYDTYPFIWNDYEDLGYITTYQEDHPSISMFNYLKNGFKFRPTSFYGRPFWSKYYNIRTGPNKCHRKYHTYSTWINLIDLFVQHMNTEINKNINYFSFNFLNEYTHDHMYVPYDLDVKLRDMIVRFEKNGYLDKTFLMIFSDHGIRMRQYGYGTDQGKLEKNNPFVSIRLPKIFKNTRYFMNAFENQFKLITFFDLFQTLKHFVQINKYGIDNDISECNKKFTINDINDRNKRGSSIFEHINVNRSCSDGLIPYEYCNCVWRKKLNEKDFKLQTNYRLNYVKSSIVNFLNQITERERKKCELFKLDHLKSIEKVKVANIIVYLFNLIVQPGNAWFEVSLKVDQIFKKKYNKIKLIIDTLPKRLSPYGNQSHCVKDVVLVNFCFCKP
jgi:hypothetical protein